MTAILALDQSLSSTGFALMDGGKIISGAWPLADSERRRPEGFRQFWHHLDKMHKGHGVGLIAYEQPPLGTVNQGQGQITGKIGLVAIIELFTCSRAIERRPYAIQSWRGTFFTKAERQAIRGHDWKQPAIQRCREFGFDPVTSDEAEAIAILDHHLHKSGIVPHWRNPHAQLR